MSQPKEEPSFYEIIKKIILFPFDKMIINTLPELGHLAPVIFTVGTAFISLISLNYPLGIFAASGVEALFISSALQTVSSFLFKPSLDVFNPTGNVCKSYFQSITPSRFRYLLGTGVRNEFPNLPIFFLAFACAYSIQSMFYYSEEISNLGPQYSSRPYLAIIASALILFIYSAYLLVYSCDTLFSILFSVLLGGLVGFLITTQNNLLFGKESVNLLFIPTLARRTGMDYICVTKG